MQNTVNESKRQGPIDIDMTINRKLQGPHSVPLAGTRHEGPALVLKKGSLSLPWTVSPSLLRKFGSLCRTLSLFLLSLTTCPWEGDYSNCALKCTYCAYCAFFKKGTKKQGINLNYTPVAKQCPKKVQNPREKYSSITTKKHHIPIIDKHRENTTQRPPKISSWKIDRDNRTRTT